MALGRRISLLLLTLVLLAASSGCSIRKVAYGWATKLLVGRLVDTFDLNAEQKRQLVPRIAALHKWHRQQELVRYVALIDELLIKVPDGIDRQEFEWMFAQGNAAMERLSTRFVPELATVLSTLSDAQIAHAVGKLRKAEAERFEKLDLPEEDYIKYRLKRARKTLKDWLGSYSDAQLQEFERFARKSRADELRRRKRYQEGEQALLSALRAHTAPQEIAEILHRWITRQEVQETSAFQQAERSAQNDFVEVMLAIDKLMTQAQRQHLLDELRAWRTDFYELAHDL